MRTVLCLDEMLAHQVRRKLEGEVETLDHMQMRDLGHASAVRRVRELVMQRRSVLVLGGRAWDERASAAPLTFLRDLRLQPFVPVVLLLAAGQEPPALSWRPRIFSIVPTDGGSQIAATIATQCENAWAYAHQRLRPVLTTVVKRDERRPPRSAPGRILRLQLGQRGE